MPFSRRTSARERSVDVSAAPQTGERDRVGSEPTEDVVVSVEGDEIVGLHIALEMIVGEGPFDVLDALQPVSPLPPRGPGRDAGPQEY